MDVTVTAHTGRVLGSRPSNRLRAEGSVPGVVYGLGRDPIPVAVPYRDLRAALTTEAGLNALISLQVDGESKLTIVKDLQRDPIKSMVIHVDFLEVDPDAEILVDVPLTLVGEASAVELEGGVVDQIHYTLAVSARPGQIPNEIEVDITNLTLTDSIKVADLTLPEGASTALDPEDTVVSAQIVREEVVEVEEVEGEVVEGEEGDAAEAPADAEGSSEDG